MNDSPKTLRIRLATTMDADVIAGLVQTDRFKEDGSGALLPVSPSQVRRLMEDASRGAFYVAEVPREGLVGCVSVVVYGLPENYETAMARLAERLAKGSFRPAAGLKVLTEGALAAGNVAELRSLVVGPTQRGKGLGAQLIEVAKKEARGRGFEELYSLTNEQAVPLFERCGFRRAERTPQKLAVDCAACPILERCNEVPVVARL